MVNIPSDITTIDQARHWLQINGYSPETIESTLADWSAMEESAPAVEDEDDEEEWEWVEEDEDEEEEE